MKISELTPASSLIRAMQIPVTVSGENRSVTLGQILDALAAAIVPFTKIDDTDSLHIQYAVGSTNTYFQSIVFDTFSNKFYAAVYSIQNVSGTVIKRVTLYSEFAQKENYYDGDNIRTDCLFINPDGRLYRFNGTALISAGITDEQAELLQKLTPKRIESESELEALQEAGEIVPGQIYFIPENE